MAWYGALSAGFCNLQHQHVMGRIAAAPNEPHELWGIPPGAGQVQLALETLTDLSNWQIGLGDEI